MNDQESQIPCLIDQGIIFNKSDMIRILQGLDQVEYIEIIDNRELSKRECFITQIFENKQEATIFFNRRAYINVNSFDFIKIHFDPSEKALKDLTTYQIDLSMPGGRIIRLRTLTDPIDNPSTLIAEVEERRRHVLTEWEEVVAEVDEE